MFKNPKIRRNEIDATKLTVKVAEIEAIVYF
ncbi:hypothetical protein DI53_1368 [Sphingobacterium deserti]|uniref:Uncharacterized protein n=1 Tax=Sphingobacterium deserti TaxID=1229276 RepID=A0A0B8T4L1_9SPHI|nr:hypothetical protein DI53_1368 [Sphingobacterium deserti]